LDPKGVRDGEIETAITTKQVILNKNDANEEGNHENNEKAKPMVKGKPRTRCEENGCRDRLISIHQKKPANSPVHAELTFVHTIITDVQVVI
jgi:hypothetical protein